jgi:hypothetical protein
VTRTPDGPLGERIDAAHALNAGMVGVRINDELIISDRTDVVTLALRVAAAVDGDDRDAAD